VKTNIKTYSDEELLKLLAGKAKFAEPAFTEIYNRYSQNVVAYCVGIIKNRVVAEDIFQETFIKFYNYVKNEGSIKSIRALLITTARNLCLNYMRDRMMHEEIDENLAPRVIDNTYENSEMFEIVMNIVDTLDLKYKEAFILREIDGMSYKEIAETLEITLINAKTRVRRAKEQIIEMLEPYINDEKKENK
jgi:RNA polymerase sigma-70 factor (ECF subfamily)